jgi:hypothetical protein
VLFKAAKKALICAFGSSPSPYCTSIFATLDCVNIKPEAGPGFDLVADPADIPTLEIKLSYAWH